MKTTFTDRWQKFILVLENDDVTVTTIVHDKFTGDDDEIKVASGYIEDGEFHCSDELDHDLTQAIEYELEKAGALPKLAKTKAVAS